MGYDYAIKLDYDMLCVNGYELDAILPKDEILSIVYKRQLKSFVQSSKEPLGLKLDNYHSVNTGFFVINLKLYKDSNFFSIFKKIYLSLKDKENQIKGETIEQFSFGAVQSVLGKDFKKLSGGYNFRPYYFPKFNKIFNLHFNRDIKPWEEFSTKVIIKKPSGWFRFFLFFNTWLKCARELEINEQIFRKRLYDEFEICEAYDLSLSCIEKQRFFEQLMIQVHNSIPKLAFFTFKKNKNGASFICNKNSKISYQLEVLSADKYRFSLLLPLKYRKVCQFIYKCTRFDGNFKITCQATEEGNQIYTECTCSAGETESILKMIKSLVDRTSLVVIFYLLCCR